MSRFKQCSVGAMCSNVAHNALNTPCKILITQGLRRVISNDISNKVYDFRISVRIHKLHVKTYPILYLSIVIIKFE